MLNINRNGIAVRLAKTNLLVVVTKLLGRSILYLIINRNAIAVRLAKTNLLLVVTELEMTDCEPCRLMIPNEELIQEPVKSKKKISIKCRIK